jgi:fermentation-respiration switch protein FrsA (DUF1100 family)
MRLMGFAKFERLPPALRWPARIGMGLLQGYLLALAVLFVMQRSFIYPTWGSPEEGAPPAGVTRVEIDTVDGERLLGYWARPLPGKPVIVSFHGNASSPRYHAERFSTRPWSANGWGYLAIAYRGYPGSTGSPSETGLSEDADAALRFVQSRAGAVPIVAHGHSIGAAVAVSLAARHPVSALFLEAPFLSLGKAADYRFPWLPTSLLLDRFPSEDTAPRLALPVHVVHGEDDPVVPFAQGKALARLFPRGDFRGIPFADHASVFGSADVAVEEALRGDLSGGVAEASAKLVE